MKIFSDTQPDNSNETAAISSIIGQDMAIVGDLSFQSKIQLDGNLQGNLAGIFLVLSESGRIIGDVVAETMVCYGKIDGNVKVGKLFLKKTGIINGRVETSDLSVESGGILNGEIKSQTLSREQPAVTAAKTKQDNGVPLNASSLSNPQKA